MLPGIWEAFLVPVVYTVVSFVAEQGAGHTHRAGRGRWAGGPPHPSPLTGQRCSVWSSALKRPSPHTREQGCVSEQRTRTAFLRIYSQLNNLAEQSKCRTVAIKQREQRERADLILRRWRHDSKAGTGAVSVSFYNNSPPLLIKAAGGYWLRGAVLIGLRVRR